MGYDSGRLESEWWSAVNGYLLMSRFTALEIVSRGINPSVFGSLEPGVQEWIDYINDPTVENFWRAHNAALREGVRRADAQGLREKESHEEQISIDTVLYNVLNLGDRCAEGEALACMSTHSFLLGLGTRFYPNGYPSTVDEALTMQHIRFDGTPMGVLDLTMGLMVRPGYNLNCSISTMKNMLGSSTPFTDEMVTIISGYCQ